jgi:hypothetical protein
MVLRAANYAQGRFVPKERRHMMKDFMTENIAQV